MSAMLGISLVALTSTGCKNLVGCDDFAAFSVTVTVEEPDGTLIPDAVVTYTVDGGPEQDCMESSPAGTFVCGVEEAGDFEITATAPGFEFETDTVTVTEDACHVIGKTLTLVVPPSPTL